MEQILSEMLSSSVELKGESITLEASEQGLWESLSYTIVVRTLADEAAEDMVYNKAVVASVGSRDSSSTESTVESVCRI